MLKSIFFLGLGLLGLSSPAHAAFTECQFKTDSRGPYVRLWGYDGHEWIHSSKAHYKTYPARDAGLQLCNAYNDAIRFEYGTYQFQVSMGNAALTVQKTGYALYDSNGNLLSKGLGQVYPSVRLAFQAKIDAIAVELIRSGADKPE